MKNKIIILTRALFTDSRYWRVIYKGGGMTRLLCFGEAWRIERIYGGKMFIDFKVKV